MSGELHLYPDVALVGPRFEERRAVGLRIAGGVIAEIADDATLRARAANAEIIDLPGQAVMAGFVNAHQHGRGITQFQLGFGDDVLETWIAGLRLSGILDPYLHTLLAALDMIACGVTGTIQANTAYGTGDIPEELRRTFRAYDEAGLRAVVGVGLWDRSSFVYPEDREAAFVAALPTDFAERLRRGRRPSFCATPEQAASVIRRLRSEHETERVKVAYAPAGPQWVSDRLISAALRDAADLGCVVHMHVLESWAQYLALRELYPEGLLTRLTALGPVDARLSFGHAVWLSARDADLAAELGVTLVRNAGSNLRLKCGAAPLAEYRRRGVSMAIGTDSFSLAEDEDILKETRLAGRLARSPRWDGPPAPEARDMLAMLTRGGAAAAGFGPKAGLLEEGAPADLVAVDIKHARGAFTAPHAPISDLIYYRADRRDIRMTMVGGDILYRDGRHTRHDRTAVAAAVADDIASAASRVTSDEREDVATLVVHIGRHYAAYAREAEKTEGPWRPLALEVK